MPHKTHIMDLYFSLIYFLFSFILLLGATCALFISKYVTQLSGKHTYTIISNLLLKEDKTTAQTPSIKSQDYDMCELKRMECFTLFSYVFFLLPFFLFFFFSFFSFFTFFFFFLFFYFPFSFFFLFSFTFFFFLFLFFLLFLRLEEERSPSP